jgi:glycosyl transferase family 2
MTAARQDPDITIVVCSVGTARLEDTVASVRDSANAAGIGYEIVVVWQVETTCPASGGDVRVIEAFPLGLSHARNRGLHAARAPIVAFVDDDELVDEGWARAAKAAFESTPRPVAAFGPVAPLDDRGLPYCHLEPGEPRVFHGAETPPWIVGTGGNMVFDRDALLESGGFDPLLGAGAEGQAGEETDVIVRLLKRGRRILWVPELGVYHPTKDESEHLAIRFPYAYGMGRALRKHRDLPHALRYLFSIRDARRSASLSGDERRRLESGQTLRGFLNGLLRRVDRRSPLRALDNAPFELREPVSSREWEPLAIDTSGPIRLSYRSNGTRLRVWIDPSDEEARELGEEAVRGRDSLWQLG